MGVTYQNQQYATPPINTTVKTTQTAGAEVQHVALDDAAGLPLVETRANTGVRALTVAIGPTDPISDIPVVMQFDHHQVHEGESHIWSVLVSSLSSGSSKDIRLVVPAGLDPTTETPHLEFEVLSTAEAEVYFYEASTYSGNGSQRTPVNRNRNSLTTPAMEIWEDPTVTGVGTTLWIGLSGSGVRAGGGDRGMAEWDLSVNQVYTLRVTSRAAANKVVIRLNWYEDLGV
jgi:hypothetical protein